MYRFPIGIMINGYRTDFKTSVELAAKEGVSGVQVSVGGGEMAIENMTSDKIRQVRQLVKDSGLVLVSTCGDIGAFADPETLPEILRKSKRILEITKELGSDIMTTHIGMIPDDVNCERYHIMQEAIHEVAEHAAGMGSYFAVETGPEPSAILKGFLDSLQTKGAAVNLDPANLAMVSGEDSCQAVRNLKDYIVHTHAKDGYQVKPLIREYLYKVKQPVPVEYQQGGFYKEVPLGTGSVNYPAYLKELEKSGYRGYLMIEREKGADPVNDIHQVVSYLNMYLNAWKD